MLLQCHNYVVSILLQCRSKTCNIQHSCRPVELDVEVPDMKEGVSFSIGFPAGSKVTDCSQMEVELPCTMEFSSVHSVSISDSVVFSDKTTGRK